MSVNSSSFNTSLLPSPPSSSTKSIEFMLKCFSSKVGSLSLTAFTATSILVLLPLFILVLYLGYQRQRQQGPGVMMSHSDLFTYHMVAIELMSVFGSTLCCCGIHADLPQVTLLGIYILSINLTGQMSFHNLTCMERYLAVIHPITYLSSRKAKWIRIRNFSIGCAWLLSFLGIGLMSMDDQVAVQILASFFIGFTLTVISFCSLSVLCVLVRPRPGEGGGARQRVDQSKLRAFYHITTILGMLLLRGGGLTLSTSLYTSPLLGNNEKCGLCLSEVWFCLPSSLVLPLLFLLRAGKLPCCKNNNESGRGSA